MPSVQEMVPSEYNFSNSFAESLRGLAVLFLALKKFNESSSHFSASLDCQKMVLAYLLLIFIHYG